MEKDMLLVILMAFVNDIQSVNAYSFQYDQAYHKDSKTWKAASEICDKKGLEFDKKVLKHIAVLQDKEFWIGMAIYRIVTPWIENIGCYSVPDGQEIKKSPSIVLCQKQCSSYQFFGFSESTENCFCKNNTSSSFNLSDCIDDTDSKYSFIYREYTGHVSDNGDGKCTTLFCSKGGNGLKSTNCNDTTDSARTTRCNDGQKVGWGKPYLTSKQLCLERSQLLLPPESYCQSNKHQNEGILSWTNVFRAQTEAKLTKDEAGSIEPLFCLAGSYTEQNTKRELTFTRRNCSDQLQFVCRLGTASTTTSKQRLVAVDLPQNMLSTTHASDFQDVKSDDDGKGLFSCNACCHFDFMCSLDKGVASSTTHSQIIIPTQKMKNDSNGSFNIGPVIGGILAAVILVALLLVVISCKIRSCGVFKTTSMDKQEVSFSTAVSEHSQNSEVRTSVTPTSNESYGLAPITSNNTYAVVNKIKKNGLQTTEDTYTETSYGEYDRLNGVPKRRTDSKTNLYDSHEGIRNETDPTYDSSNHGGRKIQLDNAVYDHTDTVPTYQSDYGYSSTIRSGVRNKSSAYD